MATKRQIESTNGMYGSRWIIVHRWIISWIPLKVIWNDVFCHISFVYSYKSLSLIIYCRYFDTCFVYMLFTKKYTNIYTLLICIDYQDMLIHIFSLIMYLTKCCRGKIFFEYTPSHSRHTGDFSWQAEERGFGGGGGSLTRRPGVKVPSKP